MTPLLWPGEAAWISLFLLLIVLRCKMDSHQLALDEAVPLTQVVPDPPYGRSSGSLHRSLELLELFAVEQRPLTVGEAARFLGYPQSSMSVLLHCLCDLGYLHHDRYARTFLPTLRVNFLGAWLRRRVLAHESLLAVMEDLADRSGHVVMLGIQNGLHAQYIHIVSARTSRVGLKPGLLRPICRSAIGKVLLSALENEHVVRIAHNVNAIDTDFPQPVDVNALLEEVEECRRMGFAFSADSVTSGSSVIATRVPVDFGNQPLAIGIGVHTWQRKELRPAMMVLLQDVLDKHFHARIGPAREPRIPTPQGNYAVTSRVPADGG